MKDHLISHRSLKKCFLLFNSQDKPDILDMKHHF